MLRKTNDIDVSLRRAVALLYAAAIVAALYLGKEILLPLALSVLLSFLLAPLVTRIERLSIHRAAAVLIAVALAFGFIGLLGSALILQVYELANNLPKYKTNVAAKMEAFRSTDAGVIKSVRDVLSNAGHRTAASASSGSARPSIFPSKSGGVSSLEKSQTDSSPDGTVDATARREPQPVEIVSEPSAGQIVQEVVGPLIGPLASAATVLIFVIFILIDRENLRNRFLHLIGSRQLNTMTERSMMRPGA